MIFTHVMRWLTVKLCEGLIGSIVLHKPRCPYEEQTVMRVIAESSKDEGHPLFLKERRQLSITGPTLWALTWVFVLDTMVKNDEHGKEREHAIEHEKCGCRLKGKSQES
jgi:hypothetical protein